MTKAILIAKTQIDWDSYLTATKRLLNKGLTKELDKRNLPLNLAAFVSTLQELKGESFSLDFAGSYLQHLSLTFLLIPTQQTLLEIVEKTPLRIVTTPIESSHYVVIATGTLEEWRTAIQNVSDSSCSLELRNIFADCQAQIQREGFGRTHATRLLENRNG